jgi:bacteriocin-like protein
MINTHHTYELTQNQLAEISGGILCLCRPIRIPTPIFTRPLPPYKEIPEKPFF